MWYGNSAGHARAGRLGGKAQGRKNNPGNFANDRKKAARAGKIGGSAKRKRVENPIWQTVTRLTKARKAAR